MTYQIGTFQLVMLNRLGGRGEGPELLDQQQTVISRPGPDGVNIRREGKRGREFQMRSVAVFATNTAALTAQGLYSDVQGLVADIIWEGVNYSTAYGVKYAVLRVSDPKIEKLGAGAWLTTNITGWWKLEATWTLQPVDDADVVLPEQP